MLPLELIPKSESTPASCPLISAQATDVKYPLPSTNVATAFEVGRLVEVDAADIYLFGRGLQFADVQDVSLLQWFPDWFHTQLGGTDKLLIVGCLLSLPLLVVWTARLIIKRKWSTLDEALVLGTVTCCYLFWQTSAPLIRYGYAYVLLLAFLTFGMVLSRMGSERIVYYCLILYGIYKVSALLPYTMNVIKMEHYVWQQEYGLYDMEEYEVNGITFYYPVEGDQSGYEYFPSTAGKIDFEFRGDTIEDGFRLLD